MARKDLESLGDMGMVGSNQHGGRSQVLPENASISATSPTDFPCGNAEQRMCFYKTSLS
jgi:hypothetical protein